MKSLRSLALLVAALSVAVSLVAQEPVTERGRFAEVNGARIYYEEFGQGEPLFLLHNFGSTASLWRPYVDDWAKGFRVIAWDMRGHGRSTNPNRTDVFLHAETARDLLGLMDALRIERARAVGASSGAMTLLYAASSAPERFDAFAIVGGQIYYSKAVRKWIEARGPGEQDPELMKQFAQLHGAERGVQLARQFWRFRELYDDPALTPDRLARITARVLIVHGDDDFVPVTQAWEMYQAIPRSRLWIVPNGGHLPFMAADNRADFARRVTEFLDGQWRPRTN